MSIGHETLVESDNTTQIYTKYVMQTVAIKCVYMWNKYGQYRTEYGL